MKVKNQIVMKRFSVFFSSLLFAGGIVLINVDKADADPQCVVIKYNYECGDCALSGSVDCLYCQEPPKQ